jgi:hypothetical protein
MALFGGSAAQGPLPVQDGRHQEGRSVRQQVEETIEAIRPALQADGGDIFLREVDEETERSIRDLQVWFNLVWFHPVSFEESPLLRGLHARNDPHLAALRQRCRDAGP